MSPQVKIDGCTDCPHFLFSGDYGAVCTKLAEENSDFGLQALESIKTMLINKTYEQYNIDFNSGALFSSVPDWCPLI